MTPRRRGARATDPSTHKVRRTWTVDPDTAEDLALLAVEIGESEAFIVREALRREIRRRRRPRRRPPRR